MFKNLKAESFAGIIVGVFILSFVILGIVSIITYSRDAVGGFKQENIQRSLEKNYETVISGFENIFTGLSYGDEFYLHRDPVLKQYIIFTGSLNSDYQYVDELGHKIPDINTYEDTIYIIKGIYYGDSTITSESGASQSVPLYKITSSIFK